MVGEEKREDITKLYKHPEGSAEERAAFENAHNLGQSSEKRKALLNKDEKNDLEIGMCSCFSYHIDADCCHVVSSVCRVYCHLLCQRFKVV